MSDCIFCKIGSGEIQSDKVYEDASFVGFRDIQPQAPTHIVIIPKKHVETINDIGESDSNLLSGLLLVCQKIARDEELSEKGYRIVINCNRDGGQFVFHLHAHLLGGRSMSWPPG
ncbi:MAG: histidine triad nucleotide-binding protein [Candidatus Hydrogenedentota bacterium]|nr:MAG: histidine triad nucleotide-binding protein [Candidatus Hydrogenedentota bacterium]